VGKLAEAVNEAPLDVLLRKSGLSVETGARDRLWNWASSLVRWICITVVCVTLPSGSAEHERASEATTSLSVIAALACYTSSRFVSVAFANISPRHPCSCAPVQLTFPFTHPCSLLDRIYAGCADGSLLSALSAAYEKTRHLLGIEEMDALPGWVAEDATRKNAVDRRRGVWANWIGLEAPDRTRITANSVTGEFINPMVRHKNAGSRILGNIDLKDRAKQIYAQTAQSASGPNTTDTAFL
jgi:hypothetical protein